MSKHLHRLLSRAARAWESGGQHRHFFFWGEVGLQALPKSESGWLGKKAGCLRTVTDIQGLQISLNPRCQRKQVFHLGPFEAEANRGAKCQCLPRFPLRKTAAPNSQGTSPLEVAGSAAPCCWQDCALPFPSPASIALRTDPGGWSMKNPFPKADCLKEGIPVWVSFSLLFFPQGGEKGRLTLSFYCRLNTTSVFFCTKRNGK